MYQIKRIGNNVPKNLRTMFDSYDEARSAVRKWLREQMSRKNPRWIRDGIDLINRTVTIGFYGFTIRKV